MLPKGGELPRKQSVSIFGRHVEFAEAEKGWGEKLLLRGWGDREIALLIICANKRRICCYSIKF